MHEITEELLERWEESYEQGQPLSAEILCREHPELLDELKSLIEALLAVEANIGRVMGSSGQSFEEPLATSRLHQRLQVTSEFEIVSLHASGGLGNVYRASEPYLNRQVAIKFPRKEHLNAEQIARFEREAQITGRLSHPGIVPVYSLKQDHLQQPYYVMRFIDGLTLRQRVEQLNLQAANSVDYFSTLEFRQLLHNFIAVCNIVAYAHDQGIIHRDIKPENIILGPFGETMLMDWGLAKILNESEANTPSMSASSCADTVIDKSIKTYAGQVMGTPAFASPEQLQGRVDLTDTRSDIYSLGATLYYIVTGTIGRFDKTSGATLRHNTGGIVPYRLIAICHKAMTESIESRYQTVTVLREDVERFLAGEPMSVVPETVWSRFVRTVRRRPGWAASLLVGVMMTVVAGTVGSLLLNQKNQQLSETNQQLESAVETALVAKQRATSTADLLSRTLQAGTPDTAKGTEPTVRQLLDDTAEKLRTETSINSLVAADTHTVIAKAYLSLGAYDAAQLHADLAADLYLRESGPNSAETLTALAHKALLLSRRDRDAEAIEIAGKALERGRQVESLDPESRVTLIDIYGCVCSAAPNPNHEQILELHREAYEFALQAFGANHRTTLNMASNRATALMDLGNLEEAEPLLIEIQKAHEALLGREHPETLVDTFNLVALKFNQGDYQAANNLCQMNMETYEKVLGPNHQRAIRLRLLLTMTFVALEQMDSAITEATIALERSKTHLGPVHQNTFEARGLLASALIGSGKIDEGQALSNEQYETAKDAFGPTHAYTIQARTLFFELAHARGDLKAMEKWFEEFRGSPWEADYKEILNTALEKKNQESTPATAN